MKRVLVLSPKSLYDIDGTSNYAYKIVLLLTRLNIKTDFLYYFKSKHELSSRKINSENLVILNDKLDYQFAYSLDSFDEHNEYIMPNIRQNFSYIHQFNLDVLSTLKTSAYDLIIDCTYFLDESWMNKANYLFVQQFEPRWYERKILTDFKLYNPLIYANNLVLYDTFQLQTYNSHKKYFFIPLSSYNKTFIKEHAELIKKNLKQKYHGDIIYFGRINNHQKNIKFLNEMNEQFGCHIKEYGPIENQTKTSNYMGTLTRSQVIEVVSNAKFCILVSQTEGFSYSLVEAISLGTPVIIRNTYPSAKYLVSYQNGFLIDKTFSPKQAAQYLSSLNELSFQKYEQLVNNCIKFAINELNTNDFEDKWIDILKHFKI